MKGKVIIGCIVDIDTGLLLFNLLSKDVKCLSLKSTKLLVRNKDDIKSVLSIEFVYESTFVNKTSHVHSSNLNKVLNIIHTSKPRNFSGISYRDGVGTIKEYHYSLCGILIKDKEIEPHEDN